MIRILPLLFLLTSCASIHSGNFAKFLNKDGKVSSGKKSSSGIIVSGQEVKSMSSKYFAQLDLTFENTTDKWIKIDHIDLSYNNSELNKLMKIPVGEKLISWAKAAQQNQEISNYNTNLALGAVTGMATGAMLLSKNRSMSIAAQGVFAVSSGSLTYRSIVKTLNQVELAKVVPASHLLNSPIHIPPGLHVKKWITVHLERPYQSPFLKEILISYRANTKKEKVLLKIRNKSLLFSKFQGDFAKLEREEENNRLEAKRKKERENSQWKPY